MFVFINAVFCSVSLKDKASLQAALSVDVVGVSAGLSEAGSVHPRASWERGV